MTRGEKTRNCGTMTDAAFFGRIKNYFRQFSMYWLPSEAYLKTIRKKRSELVQSPLDARDIYLYPCNMCKGWFPRKEVEKDHIEPCGTIRSFEDIGIVAKKMFIEIDEGWQCLCKTCHKARTLAQRKKDK